MGKTVENRENSILSKIILIRKPQHTVTTVQLVVFSIDFRDRSTPDRVLAVVVSMYHHTIKKQHLTRVHTSFRIIISLFQCP